MPKEQPKYACVNGRKAQVAFGHIGGLSVCMAGGRQIDPVAIIQKPRPDVFKSASAKSSTVTMTRDKGPRTRKRDHRRYILEVSRR